MKAIEILKQHKTVMNTLGMFEVSEDVSVAIEELKELQRENTALKITLDRLNLQYASNEALKQSMLNYDECYDKLVKAQKYIVDLENQLKNKTNGWMEK